MRAPACHREDVGATPTAGTTLTTKEQYMDTSTVTMIDLKDWDLVVESTYGRPYSLQQQGGCIDRGLITLTVPAEATDFERDTVPEEVNHHVMGVSFRAWLARDPNTPAGRPDCPWQTKMWWERNFYPNLQMVANDLRNRGLVNAGEYTINIDW